jgi:sterol desaturase/sphingolipid hydroxylase (fatty acid hydroxylase superfamily)
LLWRFHRVHHSDAVLDVTTAARFHVGEIALSALARLPLLALLGAEFWQVVLYEALLLPVIQFHHSNLAVPERWDRRLRLLIVSPNMHRVHHSRFRAETYSNYASVLSVWDRIAGTFRQRPDPRAIRFGLADSAPHEEPGVVDLLAAPFCNPNGYGYAKRHDRPRPAPPCLKQATAGCFPAKPVLAMARV